jgi:cell division protein FtsB
MKKVLAVAMALLVPGLLFLNAWEGYRYHVLTDEVEGLEKRQKELLEANMAVIAGIAREQSPEKIEEKAISSLGLVPVDQERVTRLVVGEGVTLNP